MINVMLIGLACHNERHQILLEFGAPQKWRGKIGREVCIGVSS